MLVLPLVIAILIPFCLVAGALVSFLVVPLFCRSLREAPVAGYFLKILLTPVLGVFFFFLFWAVVLIQEQIDSRDYWRYQGAYDFWRIPLEYPYELCMTDCIDEAWISTFAGTDGIISQDVSHIRRYYKQGPLVLGQCDSRRWDASSEPSWFIFDCNTGQAETFSKKEEYLQEIQKYGFEKETKLLTVRENWDRFWSKESK